MNEQILPEILETWKSEFIALRRKQYDSGYQDAFNGICARDTTRQYLDGYQAGLKTTVLTLQSTEQYLDATVIDEHILGDDDFVGNG